ncbi:MAG: MOSC domain-containing protein [Bellilinea sp.]
MIKDEPIQDLPTGVAEALLLGLQQDTLVSTRMPAVQAASGGFVGDKHFGVTHPSDSRTPYYQRGSTIFNDRQLSIVSVEDLNEVASLMALPKIEAEWLGANVLTSGIAQLSRLSPGTRLFFSGGVVLYVTHSNNPCSGPGKIIQEHFPEREGLTALFIKLAMHRRGVVAVVDMPGEIKPGETIRVRHEERYTYREEV